MTAIKIPYAPVMGGRTGTAVADLDTIKRVCGEPSITWGKYRTYPGGDKVTIVWTFNTPRGLAELRDYWWNDANEWTIAAAKREPAMWLARMLRRAGIAASTRFHDASKARLFGVQS